MQSNGLFGTIHIVAIDTDSKTAVLQNTEIDGLSQDCATSFCRTFSTFNFKLQPLI